MLKNKLGLFYALIFLIFLTYIFFRSNSYYNKLSGKDGEVTVAHVYQRDTGSRGHIYYDYIYKVGDNYYSTSTSGSNLKNLDSVCPQYFLLSYYKLDPTIHTVIRSYRFDTIIPLGLNLDTLNFDRNLIRKHTIGWGGLSPKADINDEKAMDEYETKTGKKL